MGIEGWQPKREEKESGTHDLEAVASVLENRLAEITPVGELNDAHARDLRETLEIIREQQN